MTSNVGSHFIADRALRGDTIIDAGTERQLMDALRQHFKPEFLNRVDEIVFFHALSRDDIRQVIDIQIGALLKRLADRKITLTLTDAARDLLIEEGYDPVYGARPLKRVIQRRVLDPLAIGVLQGQFHEGSTVVADAGVNGALMFKAAA
jgi:ATP-dependent Clp protease ATP-binding subunit ClpB